MEGLLDKDISTDNFSSLGNAVTLGHKVAQVSRWLVRHVQFACFSAISRGLF